MSSTSELSTFAARLREAILAPEWGARTSPGSRPMAWGRDFEALALELFALQFEHNVAYRRLCEARVARPATVAQWADIPAAPTSAFKEFDLSCLAEEDRTAVFHSSGTTGQRSSRHYHNAESLALYEASLSRWFEAHFPWCAPKGDPHEAETRRGGEVASGKWQVAILTPPALQAPQSSLAHMFETIRRELGSVGSRFVGRVAGDGAWALDLDAAVEVLREASCTGQNLLLLGTAFSYVHLLDHLAEAGLRFELPSGSGALETGGYKGRSRSLPRAELHRLIGERLGIAPSRIVCEYGMSELSSQAYDAALGSSRTSHQDSGITHDVFHSFHLATPVELRDRRANGLLSPALSSRGGEGEGAEGLGKSVTSSPVFHFPPWARVQIVSPETGREVGEGKTGLIRVIDLANVYSVMAIQTEDLGIRRGRGFALAGRAVLAEPRGCSLMAV